MNTDNSVLVSVIIPTFNSQQYISQSIDSVYSQTFKNFEIIVIDDGSTDNTRGLILSKYPRVRYYFIENQGAAHARNYGISLSDGEFIAFLDADDLWNPRKLEKQIELFFADSNLALCFTEHQFFNDTEVKDGLFKKRDRLMKGDLVKNIFLYSYVCLPSVMVKKAIFADVGMFDENLCAAEDDNLWMRIALNHKFFLLDEPLVMVRESCGSLSRTSSILFDGVEKNIYFVENKYKDLKDRLGRKCILKKKSILECDRGYTEFSKNKFSQSRKFFLKSIFFYPNLKSVLYLSFSFFPDRFISFLKKIKNNRLH